VLEFRENPLLLPFIKTPIKMPKMVAIDK
jgi:hypothetical protein